WRRQLARFHPRAARRLADASTGRTAGPAGGRYAARADARTAASLDETAFIRTAGGVADAMAGHGRLGVRALATGSAAHPGRRRAVGCARSESVRIQASGWIDRARCRWRMTVRRCPDSSEFPALVIFSAEELFGFGRITNAHLLRVPLDAFAGAIGDVAQMVRFGEQTTITEWTRRRRARLAGTQPFRMMADRVGDRLR